MRTIRSIELPIAVRLPNAPCINHPDHQWETVLVRFDSNPLGLAQVPLRICDCGARTSNGIPNFADLCRVYKTAEDKQ